MFGTVDAGRDRGTAKNEDFLWLNQVERWFAEITRLQTRLGTFHSTLALETAIEEYLTVCNEDPKPFIWHKTVNEILVSC